MFHSILEILFGCSHRTTTFPLTPRRDNGRFNGTYVVCLDCGREFGYDWNTMRIAGSAGLNPLGIGKRNVRLLTGQQVCE